MQQDGKRGSARGGRGRGRGAGRGKRGRPSLDTPTPVPVAEPVVSVVEPEPVQMEIAPAIVQEAPVEVENAPIDIEADISQLEAPTFTTITRGPPEPMLRLKWNHKVLLIGEKVLNPMIHSCDTCLLPILHYGRMIPCKHVFCLMCAKREPVKECPRCKDKVCRVEQSGLGSVFMCTHGGSRYNNKGCRRTYLSQRDLQAHINHRHVAVAPRPETTATSAAPVATEKASGANSSAGGRKSLGNTTPNATSSVRTNLMHMQQENIEDGHFSRHSRYSNSHYESSGNWSSNNYR